MNIDYKTKYLKYKKKYLKLEELMNSKGGFILSDKSDGRYLDRIIKHLSKYNLFFYRYQHRIGKPLSPKPIINKELDDTIAVFNDLDYLKIYEYLVPSYLRSNEYTQTFTKRDGTIIATMKGYPYHINFASLIYTSFLLEYELFTLVHTVINPNVERSPAENPFPTIFECWFAAGMCSKTRVYKDDILDIPENIAEKFGKELDNMFDKFMSDFIKNLSSKFPHININNIYNSIVPHEYVNHREPYDFIFKDWIERLKTLGIDIISIKTALYQTMKTLQAAGTEYIAEGTGFFSLIYLNFPGKRDAKFGSCITYSLFELYIMSRLHITAENLKLVLEIEPVGGIEKIHRIWTYVQTKLELNLRPPHAVSHWSTEFNIDGNLIKFRNMFNPPSAILNFRDNRKEMYYALLYPIIDSYYTYIMKSSLDIIYKSKIINFMYKRVEILEFLMDNPPKLPASIITSPLISPHIPKPKPNINIDTIFQEAIDNWENKKPSTNISSLLASSKLVDSKNNILPSINIRNTLGQSLLYVASSVGNIGLVREIIKTLGFDINIDNRDGSSALHGAVSGDLARFTPLTQQSNEQNRYEITKLLVQQGIDITTKNDINQTAFDKINFINLMLKIEVIKLLKPNPTIKLSDLFNYAINYDIVPKIDIIANFNFIVNDKNIPITDFNVYNDRGQSLLYLAARAGNVDLVQQLLNFPSININIKNIPPFPNPDTPLRGAHWGKLAIDARNPNISQNRETVKKLLMAKGAHL